MYNIKQLPEDFIVKEISYIKPEDNGNYSYFILKKRNYATIKALKVISDKLKKPIKHFGFAGNKDKIAITQQLISIKNTNIRDFGFKDIELKYLGNSNEPVSLGDLEGNEFVITVRNLDKNKINYVKKIINNKMLVPNYFGEQRFSKNNYLIGKEIIKRNFKKALWLILSHEWDIEKPVKDYIKKNKNDYIGALRKINKKLLKLYVHSYQSRLWNKAAEEYIISAGIKENTAIPIIGFGLEEIKDKKLKKIIDKIMEKENIFPRDFIISQLPELSSEGNDRDLFIRINNLRIIKTDKDELNKNKQKMIVSFSLRKGSYATEVIKYLFS